MKRVGYVRNNREKLKPPTEAVITKEPRNTLWDAMSVVGH